MSRLRVLAVVGLGAVASFVIALLAFAAVAAVGLIARPGPHQAFEIIAVAGGLAVAAVGAAVIFAIVLAVRGGPAAIRRTAIVLAVLLGLVLAAPAIFGLATMDRGDPDAADALAALVTFLVVVAIPGLVAILVQWWVIRRYLFPSAVGARRPAT